MAFEVSSVVDDCHVCGSDDVELISPKGYQELQCNHHLCIDCWRGTARLKPICPMCRENIKIWMEYMEFDICTQSVYDLSTYDMSDDEESEPSTVGIFILLPPVFNANFDGDLPVPLFRGSNPSTLGNLAHNMLMRFDVDHIRGGDVVMVRNLGITQEDFLTYPSDDSDTNVNSEVVNTLPGRTWFDIAFSPAEYIEMSALESVMIIVTDTLSQYSDLTTDSNVSEEEIVKDKNIKSSRRLEVQNRKTLERISRPLKRAYNTKMKYNYKANVCGRKR